MRVTRVEKSALISPALMRFSMSGFTQNFRFLPIGGVAMNDRDFCASAKQIERRLGRRIFAADYDHVLVPIRMGFAEVVRNVRQILAGNAQRIRTVVVAGGDNDFPRAIFFPAPEASRV